MMESPAQAKKVLFVITGSGVGGAEKMLYYTMRGLNRERYAVMLCSLKQKGAFARRLESEGVEVHSLDMPDNASAGGWLGSLRALVLLIRYVRSERPAIVHSFLFRANLLARIAGYFTGVPVVISSVRVMGGEAWYHRLIDRLTAFMADHFIAVSNQVRENVIRHAGVSDARITTIYNGVDLEKSGCSADESGFLHEAGLKKSDRIVMTAGRLHRQKGFDCLIQAMVRVEAAVPGVKLVILGEGEEEKNLKKLADSLELTDKVFFAGLRSDVDRVLHCCEIFVLPSRWEGLPNVLLEAMAAGKPVVATAVGGIPELVALEKTGILVPAQNIEALAGAITRLLSDEKAAQAMGAAGRERVLQHFSMRAMLARTEELYQQLLERNRAA